MLLPQSVLFLPLSPSLLLSFSRSLAGLVVFPDQAGHPGPFWEPITGEGALLESTWGSARFPIPAKILLCPAQFQTHSRRIIQRHPLQKKKKERPTYKSVLLPSLALLSVLDPRQYLLPFLPSYALSSMGPTTSLLFSCNPHPLS